MFSGIIQEVGKVKRISEYSGFAVFEIFCPKIAVDINQGDSVSVNGVCLTAEKVSSDTFQASLSVQTQRETNLGKIRVENCVNLEGSLKMGDKIGGHFLTGHIDFMTKLKSLNKRGGSILLSFEVPRTFEKYVVNRGSIGVDGISLTIAELRGNEVQIFLIPFTIENSNLKHKKSGDILNIEVDILAKYVEKNLSNLRF
ncbi:riboflavin synthase [bacterium]|nr:riboflavin synthase [bacterium]